MDKPKRNRKTTWRLWLIGGSICLIVLCAFVFILQFFFPYRNTTKIKSKEEMFQFVIENQEELEQIVKDMEEFYEKSDKLSSLMYPVDMITGGYIISQMIQFICGGQMERCRRKMVFIQR